MNAPIAKDIDEYIADFPPEARKILQALRQTIHKAVPGLQERISYRIPTFDLDGRHLVYIAGFKGHVGIYPAPRGDAEIDAATTPYRHGKGTLRFALDEPLPLPLITRVVRHMAAKHRERAAATKPNRAGKKKTARASTQRSAGGTKPVTRGGRSRG